MSDTSNTSFYWYDFETWGTDPKTDPPCQFAGIRTDTDLNIIGEPLNIYSRIPNDYLPNPQACLITGITPQTSLQKGFSEAEFIKKIHHEVSTPNTCTLGYNSLRFDDEVMRFTYYRNFYDPYAREWQNNNSRWDLIDVIRAIHAVRPEGVNWPLNDDGQVSFKLESLAKENGLTHEHAHDAMSDVYATIELAKRAKQAQPKLFNYLFSYRKKQKLAELINLYDFKVFLHVSASIPASQGCSTWVLPLAYHPSQTNAIICIDLNQSIDSLFNQTAEQLHETLYATNAALRSAHQARPPIKLIHLNKCPILLPAAAMTEERADELGIDKGLCLSNLNQVKQHVELTDKLVQLFSIESQFAELDPEQALYSGGFFSNKDRSLMEQILHNNENSISYKEWGFEDSRLDTLLFRYRARNFPHTLMHDEQLKWQQHRNSKLIDSGWIEKFQTELKYLAEDYQNNPDKTAIIKSLFDYIESL